tara:strand:- start:447 stop:683 length:237 start_codon:yes stop_codon:yes gene_type:complete
MKNFNNDILSKIYSFDNTFIRKYNECIKEFKIKINVRHKFKNVIHSIGYLRFGPIFRIPCYLNKNVNFYLFLKIMRIE